MLSFLRAPAPPRRITATQREILYEDGKSSQTFYGAQEQYFVRHIIPSKSSFLNPPMHIHFYQSETFWVEKGTGVWHQPTAANPAERHVPRSPGETAHLPAGTYHYFANATDDEPLVVRFRVDPKLDGVQAESMFRNFFGYLDDCRVAGVEPSVFQLQLFMSQIQVGIAIPIPGPDVVKWWVSRIMMLLMGVVIGEWLLGYKRSYDEYYCGKDTE